MLYYFVNNIKEHDSTNLVRIKQQLCINYEYFPNQNISFPTLCIILPKLFAISCIFYSMNISTSQNPKQLLVHDRQLSNSYISYQISKQPSIISMNNIIQQEIQISEQHLTMMRSRNSRSQARIKPQLEHSQSQRMFYINDQLSRTKDISTIFHSPFKNGRKNTDYSNPTFLSSSIFYPQEEVKNQHSVRHNLVYNKNQKSKKQLYEKRIHRADDITVAVHQAAASDLHNRDRSRRCEPDNTSTLNRSRSFARNDRNDQLTKELEALIKYREQEEKKNKACRILTESLGENLPSETPVYIQKNRLEAEERAVQENKKNLKEWIQISEKIRSLKDTASQEGKKVENKALDSFVLNNVQRAYERDIENRKNAGMLATILREQIKQTQNKKNKQRKERYSFI